MDRIKWRNRQFHSHSRKILVIDRTTRQKTINKVIGNLNNAINHFVPAYIYKTLHSTAGNTFTSTSHVTLTKTICWAIR